jgi:hypothetical protein
MMSRAKTITTILTVRSRKHDDRKDGANPIKHWSLTIFPNQETCSEKYQNPIFPFRLFIDGKGKGWEVGL